MNLLRFLLDCYFALVLGISGLAKIDRPRLFAVTLRRHGILPTWSVGLVSRVFPWLEVLVAGMLIANVVPMYSVVIALFLFGGFLVIEGVLLATKRAADCGCYGGAHRQRVDSASVTTSGLLVALAAAHLWLVMQGAMIDWQWRLMVGIPFGVVTLFLVQRSVVRHRMSRRLANSRQVSVQMIPREEYVPRTR